MTWSVVGFQKQKVFFEQAVSVGGLGHAYIFSGQAMIGKKTFALELANLVTEESMPDVLFVSPAGSDSGQSIAIEEVRKIKNFVSFRPHNAEYKFIIIDDADFMTIEAQNALLKILEEPSASSILVLISAYPEALLPTVFSRCQEIKFFPHKRGLIDAVLVDSKLSKTNQEFLAEFANGRIGLAKSIVGNNLFDQVEDAIKKIMHLTKADINERLVTAQKLTDDKNKADLPQLVLCWMLYLRTRLSEPKTHKILKNLLALREVVNKPQYNQRLALENFLVSL